MLNCPYCEHELSSHEIAVLHRTFHGRKRGKLNAKAAEDIRNSKKPLKALAKKYKVTLSTAWKVREKKTWATKLVCPYCEHGLTEKQINKLFATLGGMQGRKWRGKLTPEAVKDIRSSKLTYKQLAEKHNVGLVTIWKVKAYKVWKD